MVIENTPFVPKRLEEERATDTSQVVAIRFNKKELAELESVGRLLSQEKLSTTVKHLIDLGVLCLHDQKTVLALDIQRNNHRRNQRIGITEVEPHFT